MDGKGDEKNPITDNFCITAFPSNEYVLTISGGEWYRLSLNKEKEITKSKNKIFFIKILFLYKGFD